jgi:DNA transformation protein and related proteins
MPLREVVQILDLPNLGARSREMLALVGIHSRSDLEAVGAIAAYVKVKRSGAKVSLNLLWALEGALTDQHWQIVAREQRTSLLLALEAFELNKVLV